MSFVKLDAGILDSTLWAARPQLEIFLAALLKAQPQRFESEIAELAHNSTETTGYTVPPGWYGFVPASGPGLVRLALAGAAAFSHEDGMRALASLAQPEAESRSAAFEGRRMIRVDRGYVILNFMRYRDHDSSAAVRMKLLRERRKTANPVPNVTEHVPAGSGTVTEAEDRGQIAELKESGLRPDVDAERVDQPSTTNQERTELRAAGRRKAVPFAQIVALYHEMLPTLPSVEKLDERRRGYIRQRWAEDLPSLDAWRNFFDDVSRSNFLMGRAKPTGDRAPFLADFEWICRPKNFVNILEGKYHRG
jgi:hypothetical protein